MSLAGISFFKGGKKRDKEKKVICLKKHIWGVICCIVTPDGKFRLTTEDVLAWSDCSLTCRSPLPHPACAEEVEQLLAPWASSPLAFLPFGCSFPHCVYRQGCLSLATPETSSLCSYLFKTMFCWATKVWCLKVADACHDRHGFSWAEWWLEVTAGFEVPQGFSVSVLAWALRIWEVSQSTFAHLEITVRKNVALRGLRTGTCVCTSSSSCSREDYICGLWDDKMQAESMKPGATEEGLLKIMDRDFRVLC